MSVKTGESSVELVKNVNLQRASLSKSFLKFVPMSRATVDTVVLLFDTEKWMRFSLWMANRAWFKKHPFIMI